MRTAVVSLAMALGLLLGTANVAQAHTGLEGPWEVTYPICPGGIVDWTFTEDLMTNTFQGNGTYLNSAGATINCSMNGNIYAGEFYVSPVVLNPPTPHKTALAIFGLNSPNLGGLVFEFWGIIPTAVIHIKGRDVGGPN